LLATPTSNLAIVGGKVLGSVVPALLYSLLAEVTYLAAAAAMLRPAALRHLSAWLGPVIAGAAGSRAVIIDQGPIRSTSGVPRASRRLVVYAARGSDAILSDSLGLCRPSLARP
jgi:hypothetical protein